MRRKQTGSANGSRTVPSGGATGTFVLEGKEISHRYTPDGPQVIDNVSLRVASGEFVAFVGASGCGKTTYLSILAGLIAPSNGTVLIDGENATGIPSTRRAMVFQHDRLFPWRTALQNVTFGLELRRELRSTARERSRDALALVGLRGNEEAYPRQLSGGMRQRVNMARALVMEPEFLLMDEPFASLDAQTREVMQVELLRILGSTGAGVVFITHQIEEALYLADTVLVMGARPGRIRKTITVPFARPRQLALKRTTEFQALCEEVWLEIEDDVRAAGAVRLEEAANA